MSGAYLIRRSLETLLIFFLVATLNFFLPRVIPGDPAERFYADPRVSPEDKARIMAQFGLDKPLPEQFWLYLKNMARGDMGISFNHRRPVMEVIASRIPHTLILTLSAFIISLVLGLPLGAYAAWKRGGPLDMAVLSTSIVFSAIPSFWFALLLLMVFAFYWPVLPAYGMTDPNLTPGLNLAYVLSLARHAVLPVGTLATLETMRYAILMRSSMIETLGKPYIIVARSKGLTERMILFRHVVRNAMLPVITSLGMKLPALLGGVVIIESIFSWEGMGQLILTSSRSLDYPLMQGVFLLLAALTLLGNFLADISYALFDPRVELT
ncbi:MAG TPA: ABC transporter permease [Anaerolineae bacterium]|nr:ABC transporter permease [Anaerolineae bacterium]